MKIYATFITKTGKWLSTKYESGKSEFIGYFGTKDEALLGIPKIKKHHNINYDKKNNLWKATKQINKKQVLLGYFKTEKEAELLINRIQKEQRIPYIKNHICYIPLPNNQKALCDEDRITEISKYNWSLANGYVNAFIKKQKRRMKLTHFLYPDTSLFIDHINHNILDNRACNLRICSNKENIRNSQRPKNNTSNYKGVFYHQPSNKYRAAITSNRKRIHIGCFSDIIEAAKAYDREATRLFGEFACLNFPN